MARMAQTQTTWPIDHYLTAKEVSDALSVTTATLYLWAKEGRGPRGVRIGREMRWAQSEIARWLDQLPTA